MADDDTDKKWWKDKEKLVPGLIGAAVRANPPSLARAVRARSQPGRRRFPRRARNAGRRDAEGTPGGRRDLAPRSRGVSGNARRGV